MGVVKCTQQMSMYTQHKKKFQYYTRHLFSDRVCRSIIAGFPELKSIHVIGQLLSFSLLLTSDSVSSATEFIIKQSHNLSLCSTCADERRLQQLQIFQTWKYKEVEGFFGCFSLFVCTYKFDLYVQHRVSNFSP